MKTAQMVWIEGGTFVMGSDRFYPEEQPTHEVAVDGFWIDPHPVTNGEYSRFVAETGYRTIAERPLDAKDFPGAPAENLLPGSMLFQMTRGPVPLDDYTRWWVWAPGTSWRRPRGPSDLADAPGAHPVVHVAYEDALAYATWAGKDLPTEAEWEFAARGGLHGMDFVWGPDEKPGGPPLANTWQGEFPWQNLQLDGYTFTSPVGTYPPNGYGLFDMAGNVWEWTSDWYVPSRAGVLIRPCCGIPVNPRISSPDQSYDLRDPRFRIPRRVVKGGSHLCAPSYCLRYRPAARQAQAEDTGMSHLGFRCVRRSR